MLTALLYDLWAALRQAQVDRRTVAELSALDDRLLRDIGLCRGEIGRAAGRIPQTRMPKQAEAGSPEPVGEPCGAPATATTR